MIPGRATPPAASGMSLGAIARHVLFVSRKGLFAQLDDTFVPDSASYDDADWAAGGVGRG